MADWGAGASGAASGAAAGSVFGAPGAAVGGVVGGLVGLFGGKKKKKKSSFDKKQKKLNQQQFDALHGEGPFADLYSYNPEKANEVFDKTIANPAYRKFNEDLAPGITGQFRSNGLQNSSYAGDALSKTARDIQESLDAQRSKYLYGQEQDVNTRKSNALENYQNRNTQYMDSNNSGGFNIDSILNSISPEVIDKAKNWFNKPNAQGTALTSGATNVGKNLQPGR